MMRHVLVAVLMCSAGVCLAAKEEEGASRSSGLAVLDPMGAILLTKEAQAAEKAMQKELEGDHNRLKKIEGELEKLGEKYKRDEAVMAEGQKQELQKSIRDMQEEGKFLAKKLQQRVQEERQEILSVMQPKLKAVLDELVKERQFTMIMNRQAAIYTSDAADITDEVAERLNKAN